MRACQGRKLSRSIFEEACTITVKARGSHQGSSLEEERAHRGRDIPLRTDEELLSSSSSPAARTCLCTICRCTGVLGSRRVAEGPRALTGLWQDHGSLCFAICLYHAVAKLVRSHWLPRRRAAAFPAPHGSGRLPA